MISNIRLNFWLGSGTAYGVTKPKNNMVLNQFTPGVHVFKTKESILREEGYVWHIVSGDGQIVAQNYRTYATKTMALNSIRLLHDVFRFDFEGEYFDHNGQKVKVKKTWC